MDNRYTENQVVAKEFEMQVNEVATSIDARTVPAVPMLLDHQSGQESCVTPSVGKRNMIDKKMYNGVKVDFWVCLNFSSLHSGFASRFSTELVNMCVGKGMNFNMGPVFPARAFSPLKIGKALADVASIASKAQKQLQLMILILPDHSESYGEIERICQTELDIIVQCCELRFISSIRRMEYSEKVALEINAKVVTKYRSSVSAQGPREETIKDAYKVVNDPKRGLKTDASDNGSTFNLFMKIFVAFLDAEMITLEAKSSDTIESVKNMIWENQSIPPHQQFLIIGRHTQLEDGRSLADYNIQNESTITLLLNSLPSIYISVRTTMGNILPLTVKVSDTIANVKTKIEDTSSVSPEYQILYYQDQQLQDGWTVTDCNLDENSTIHLFLNLRGSMMILVNYGIDNPIFLEVKSSYTIKKIKAMIWEKLELPANQHSLRYGGMELEDGMTIADYNIVRESIIDIF